MGAVMETPIYIALSRQLTLQRQLEVVANNVANASTPGFKSELMVMSEVKLPAEKGVKLSYVQDLASARDFSQGGLKPTNNDLDLAIEGHGFFAVRTPEGIKYTRVGRFQLNENGILVTSQGYEVMAGGGTVTVDPDDGPINVASDGTISTDRARDGQFLTVLGQLDLVDFADRASLQPGPDNLYTATTRPIGAEGSVVQGMLEDSNVNPIIEMTNLIEVTRSYQSVQRFMESEHERMRRAINNITSSS